MLAQLGNIEIRQINDEQEALGVSMLAVEGLIWAVYTLIVVRS